MYNTSLLQAALIGYNQQLAAIDKAMVELRLQLGDHPNGTEPNRTEPQPAVQRRRLSAATRRRMGVAQRKRWAAIKKAQR